MAVEIWNWERGVVDKGDLSMAAREVAGALLLLQVLMEWVCGRLYDVVGLLFHNTFSLRLGMGLEWSFGMTCGVGRALEDAFSRVIQNQLW